MMQSFSLRVFFDNLHQRCPLSFLENSFLSSWVCFGYAHQRFDCSNVITFHVVFVDFNHTTRGFRTAAADSSSPSTGSLLSLMFVVSLMVAMGSHTICLKSAGVSTTRFSGNPSHTLQLQTSSGTTDVAPVSLCLCVCVVSGHVRNQVEETLVLSRSKLSPHITSNYKSASY